MNFQFRIHETDREGHRFVNRKALVNKELLLLLKLRVNLTKFIHFEEYWSWSKFLCRN